MKQKLFFTTLFTLAAMVCFAQNTPEWKNWSWLIGEWVGEGSGQPGQGGGKFSFSFDLNERILVRKSHTEFPAMNNRPASVHDDLMVIYPDNSGTPTKSIYFDNEGHTINYTISYLPNTIILTSGKEENMPIFRLTYNLLENGSVNTKFEMSQDGVQFMKYIEGVSIKK